MWSLSGGAERRPALGGELSALRLRGGDWGGELRGRVTTLVRDFSRRCLEMLRECVDLLELGG